MSAAMEKAYVAIKEAIFSGRYGAGERLKERDICTELEVSRTPVREALRRLEADGLVRLEPRRGAVVTELGIDEANEIFSLGALLESFGAGLAARRASPDDVAALDRLLDEMSQLLQSGHDQVHLEYMRLDHDLHGRIVEIAANRRLAALLRQTVGMPVLVKSFHSYSMDDLKRSLDQHRTIVDAIRVGDTVWAEAAMRSHILVTRSLILPPADS
ncbi:MAG: GntR family transcriptional regulator [Xanthomonadales bacterium]|nr:GntR family transcriptional regulator [Xanthomonadales bacterium]